MSYNKKQLIKIALIQCPLGFNEKELKDKSIKQIINSLNEINPSWKLFPFRERIQKEIELKYDPFIANKRIILIKNI